MWRVKVVLKVYLKIVNKTNDQEYGSTQNSKKINKFKALQIWKKKR